jgi:hypothetical protein
VRLRAHQQRLHALLVCLAVGGVHVCLRARRRNIAQGCACADIFVWGELGSNACPAGSYVILDDVQCESAAVSAGQRWVGSSSQGQYLKGCFWNSNNGGGVFRNTDPTPDGSILKFIPEMSLAPLCAIGAAGGCVLVCFRVHLRDI